MKILITAYHIDGTAKGGGSGRFMKCLADSLTEMGHNIVMTTEPEEHIEKDYDLIICSHFLHRIKDNPAPKICVSHGIVDNEWVYPGAQKYVAISEEVKQHNLTRYGIMSTVINQPIEIREQVRPNRQLTNILVIRRHDPEEDPFFFLRDKFNLKCSNPDAPIEDQIAWADLVITLGRGALEAMAQGKPVLIADNRDYMGALGDGYVTRENIDEIAKCNFSGRRYKIPLTQGWIEDELLKYNPDDSDFLREYVSNNYEVKEIARQYLNMVDQNTKKIEAQPGFISVIIPVLNQHDMTTDCINAVMENTENYEIVIIDNGSDPPYKPPFSGFNEIRVIRNEENVGFPAAINQGLREAKGEFIVLLNNDVIVTPGAINRLAEWLNRREQVEVIQSGDDSSSYIDGTRSFGIVGPITNYCAGSQCAQIPTYETIEELNKEADAVSQVNQGASEEVNWVIGFCMAFRRALWEEIGDFDATLWPCTGEEIDFCLRAKEAGYKVGIVYDVYVHHDGSVTFRDLQDQGQLDYNETCIRNEKYLQEKWGNDVWKKQSIAEDVFEKPTSGINLNLGCGYAHIDGCVNIDNRPEVKPDLVCDITEGLPYEDSTVDSVRAHDFLEHIPIGKVISVMDEIWRVLKPGGKFDSLTPDAEYGQGAFQDPGHVSFWVENSWLYYSKPEHRALYGIKANFHISRLDRLNDDNRIFHLHVIAEAIKGNIDAD